MTKAQQSPLNLRGLVDAAGAALNSIKLNGISTRRHHGRPLRVKRRKRGSEQIAALANMFFPLAKAPIMSWANSNHGNDGKSAVFGC